MYWDVQKEAFVAAKWKIINSKSINQFSLFWILNATKNGQKRKRHQSLTPKMPPTYRGLDGAKTALLVLGLILFIGSGVCGIVRFWFLCWRESNSAVCIATAVISFKWQLIKIKQFRNSFVYPLKLCELYSGGLFCIAGWLS